MDRKNLVIGAGPHWPKTEGTILLDVTAYDATDVVWDLNKRPWPFDDGSMKHINASHVLEHLNDFPGTMDEAWRLLNPGGSMLIKVPHAGCLELAFSDPTHKLFFTEFSFLNYITIEGVERFGYTRHAWNPVFLHNNNGQIVIMLYPIPDEYLTDPTLRELHSIYGHSNTPG